MKTLGGFSEENGDKTVANNEILYSSLGVGVAGIIAFSITQLFQK